MAEKHKLINVHLEPIALEHVGEWSGGCTCRKWVGFGRTVAALKRVHADHVKFRKGYDK